MHLSIDDAVRSIRACQRPSYHEFQAKDSFQISEGNDDSNRSPEKEYYELHTIGSAARNRTTDEEIDVHVDTIYEAREEAKMETDEANNESDEK